MTAIGIYGSSGRMGRAIADQIEAAGARLAGGVDAGGDPRALAHMFETIEKHARSSGGSGPEWMSSHPNPGNRTVYITKEAESLTVATAELELV